MIPQFRRKVEIQGEEYIVARARSRDIKDIQALYDEVYEGKFTLPEIIQRKKMERILKSPDHLWVVAVKDKRICASYIFAFDHEKLIGKLYAAVVHPDFRGKDLMVIMIKTTKKFLQNEGIYLDTVYATFRTVSLAPRKVLSELGFRSLGIFPNVHRVDEEETHGLQAWFSEDAMEKRKKPPFLLPEMASVYEIVREQMELEEAIICEDESDRELKFDKIHHGEIVKRMYRNSKKKGEMIFDFFPLHVPNVCFENKAENTRVYIYVEHKDGHSCITGIRPGRNHDLVRILKATVHAAASMRMDYIELLVSAYDVRQQKASLDSGFLPCAYYPSFDLVSGERIDYIICAYSARDLNFANVRLFETDRKFVDAYLRNTKYRNILPRVYSDRKKRK